MNYKNIYHGHLYQAEKTGDVPVYDKNYSQERYDKYPHTDKMSELRYYLVSTLFNFNSVLDFGYGNGSFLKHCHKMQKSCFGYDISDYPLAEGITKVESATENEYDLITFFDSLEHIEDENIVGFLQSLRCKFIFISLPWYHNFGDEWFNGWKHRRENEHFHHFTCGGLCSALEMAGFTPVYTGNPEDQIRKSDQPYPNILSVGAVKIEAPKPIKNAPKCPQKGLLTQNRGVVGE
jgi:hypothetical protein